MTTHFNRRHAEHLDEQDELGHFRERFVVENPDLIYLLANSLGRLPKATVERVRCVVEEEWGQGLIRSWSDNWLQLPQTVGDKIAQLLGAQAGEILLADSTSVNLYKVLMAALRLQQGRRKIVTDELNFSSDLYILQGITEAIGNDYYLEIVPSSDGIHGSVDALSDAVDEDTALVAMSHTVFKSAYVYDMAAINRLAHQKGALVVWDLSHSAGSVPVHLRQTNADFAVGCTYKYLNGGPGAPAFLYVREDLQERVQNPISGWMGQDYPFNFSPEYRPATGLRRFLTGTPSILSLAAVEPGIDLLVEAGMDRVHKKSIGQTTYLIALWETYLRRLGFDLRAPLEEAQRGSHVSFGHREGLRISQALKQEMNVLLDFRSPDNLRFSVSPLYTTYVELFDAVQRLRMVVAEHLYQKYSRKIPFIT